MHKFLCGLLAASAVQAQVPNDTTLRVVPMAYVDAAYCADANHTADNVVPYSTTPSRTNTFMITLARGGVSVETASIRGVLQLHAGTFVDANYVGADSSWKYIANAMLGFQVTPGLRVNAGIMDSHLGAESMMPAANWTYSRSLSCDYTPYYETGVNVTWQADEHVVVAGYVANGWQKIVDDNVQKSFGTQLIWTPTQSMHVSWSTYVGRDANTAGFQSTRYYSNLYAVMKSEAIADVMVGFDIGTQKDATGASNLMWYTEAMIRRVISNTFRVAARVETYHDPSNMLVATPNGNPFNVISASFTLDVIPTTHILWRTEVRGYTARDVVFPIDGSGYSTKNSLVVTSLSFML